MVHTKNFKLVMFETRPLFSLETSMLLGMRNHAESLRQLADKETHFLLKASILATSEKIEQDVLHELAMRN